jgi:hypothetical protein
MDIQALFGLSVLMSFVAFGLVTKLYLWPRLRIAERDDALVALVAPHTFRFVCVGSNVAPVGITRYGETIEATPPAQRRPARSPAAMSRLSRHVPADLRRLAADFVPYEYVPRAIPRACVDQPKRNFRLAIEYRRACAYDDVADHQVEFVNQIMC